MEADLCRAVFKLAAKIRANSLMKSSQHNCHDLSFFVVVHKNFFLWEGNQYDMVMLVTFSVF